MTHLGISGGGTKISGLFGAVEVLMLEKGFKPDIISGISAGAILSVPLALGRFDLVRRFILNFTLDDFFSQRPVNRKGNLNMPRVMLNLLLGRSYFGRQDALEETIGKVISEDDFQEYRRGRYATCIIGTVDFNTGARVYFNLKALTYQQYLKAVNASSSLPMFTNGIKLERKQFGPQCFVGRTPADTDFYLYDGSVRDHIGTNFILDNMENIKESVSVYSRPEDYKIIEAGQKLSNIFKVINRYIEITNIEISKTDEEIERAIAQRKGIKAKYIFLNHKTKSIYDINPERLRAQYEEGRQKAHLQWDEQ